MPNNRALWGGDEYRARVRRADQIPPPPPPPSKPCCPMVAAVRSARRGRYRLARRYAAWSVRLIAARLT